MEAEMRLLWTIPFAITVLFLVADHPVAKAVPNNAQPLNAAAAPDSDMQLMARRGGGGRAVGARGARGGAAFRGPRGGAVARGPRGGVAARGPRGNVAVRGPRGRAAVRGPRGNVAVRGARARAGAYRVGGRYYGGVWYGTGRRFWGGRWWPYGVGS